jgi:O-antigen/teichoic acid export membrane protein
MTFQYPSWDKVKEWCRLVAATGSAQVVIQGIGFACGILIIRLLPTEEYALYTLANTMLGTLVVLADGGITNSLMAQGGKVWKDQKKLGSILVTGYVLRKRIALYSLVIALPVLFFLLRHHNFSHITALLVIISIVPAFIATLSGSLLAVGPQLHQSILPLKKIEILASLGRLSLLLTVLFSFPWAYIALVVAGVPQIWANFRIRRISRQFVDWKQEFSVEVYKNTMSFVRRIIPSSIFYSLSGQLTIWLISIFGSTTAVAQIGALGRLSMILSLFNVLFVTLVIPRFARLPLDRNVLLKKFLLMQIGLLMLFAPIVAIVAVFPEYFLMILGDRYSDLSKELVLSVLSGCISLLAGLIFTIASSRNWAINPLISIPLTTLAIIAGVVWIDISTLSGILWFNIFVAFFEFLVYLVFIFINITKS